MFKLLGWVTEQMEVTPAKAEHRDDKLLKKRTCRSVRGNTEGANLMLSGMGSIVEDFSFRYIVFELPIKLSNSCSIVECIKTK